MEINLKLKVSCLYSSLFVVLFFTDFPKNGGGLTETEKLHLFPTKLRIYAQVEKRTTLFSGRNSMFC